MQVLVISLLACFNLVNLWDFYFSQIFILIALLRVFHFLLSNDLNFTQFEDTVS